MSPEYCEVDEIDSMNFSKYRKVTLQNGNGKTVYLWSRGGAVSPEAKDEPELVILSKDVLLKPQLEDIQVRVLKRGVKGGCEHRIEDDLG